MTTATITKTATYQYQPIQLKLIFDWGEPATKPADDDAELQGRIDYAMQQSTNVIRLYCSGMRYMQKLSAFTDFLESVFTATGGKDMTTNKLKNLPGRIAQSRLLEIYDDEDGKMKRYLAFDIIRNKGQNGFICMYALDDSDNKLYKTSFQIVQLYELLRSEKAKFLCN